MSFTYKFPMPCITGDVIVFDEQGDRILLLKRKHDPHKDCWAIVGGFFNPIDNGADKMDKTVEAAAIRELLEEVNINMLELSADTMDWQFVTIQDAPGRDPRGRVVTMVYALTLKNGVDNLNIFAQDDAAEVQWFSVREILDGTVPLAFDHRDSIVRFVKKLGYV
jgi:8-oxo-dGTP diphosphatase